MEVPLQPTSTLSTKALRRSRTVAILGPFSSTTSQAGDTFCGTLALVLCVQPSHLSSFTGSFAYLAGRQDRSEYTAYSNKHILDVLHPVSPVVPLPEQLHALGVPPDMLDTVIFRYDGTAAH